MSVELCLIVYCLFVLGTGAAASTVMEGPAAQVALPVQHVLSDELLTLFEQVSFNFF